MRRVPLRQRRFLFDLAKRSAHCRAAASPVDSRRQTGPANDQRSGEHERQIVSSRARHRQLDRCRLFSHRYGFAGQQRLVGREIHRGHQDAVGGNAIALREHEDVAGHDFAPRDSPPHPATHDQGARTRQIAERLERPLRFALLIQRDRGDHDDEHQQDDRFLNVAEQQVSAAAGEQQQSIGSRTTSRAIRSTDRGWDDGSSLKPSRAILEAASASESPARCSAELTSAPVFALSDWASALVIRLLRGKVAAVSDSRQMSERLSICPTAVSHRQNPSPRHCPLIVNALRSDSRRRTIARLAASRLLRTRPRSPSKEFLCAVSPAS